MNVEDAINMFFETIRTQLYLESKYLEADEALAQRDKLKKHIDYYATYLDDTQLDGVYDDGRNDGYAEAVDNLEKLVCKHRSLFKDEKAFIQFKNEVDHCL